MPDTMDCSAAKCLLSARVLSARRFGFFELFRKTRNRRERPAQAFGIQAGLGIWRQRECPRGPAKIAALLTYRAVRCNIAAATARNFKSTAPGTLVPRRPAGILPR